MFALTILLIGVTMFFQLHKHYLKSKNAVIVSG